MTTITAAPFRRWTSTANPSMHAAELTIPLGPPEFQQLVTGLTAAALTEYTFAVARIDPALDEKGLRQVFRMATDSAPRPRLCLALDLGLLRRLDPAIVDSNRFGILLDSVDEDTPLGALADDAIEAVRFRSDFVLRAGHSLRIACVLESFLLLARNLGLLSMGPGISTGPSTSQLLMDYTPSALHGSDSMDSTRGAQSAP